MPAIGEQGPPTGSSARRTGDGRPLGRRRRWGTKKRAGTGRRNPRRGCLPPFWRTSSTTRPTASPAGTGSACTWAGSRCCWSRLAALGCLLWRDDPAALRGAELARCWSTRSALGLLALAAGLSLRTARAEPGGRPDRARRRPALRRAGRSGPAGVGRPGRGRRRAGRAGAGAGRGGAARARLGRQPGRRCRRGGRTSNGGRRPCWCRATTTRAAAPCYLFGGFAAVAVLGGLFGAIRAVRRLARPVPADRRPGPSAGRGGRRGDRRRAGRSPRVLAALAGVLIAANGHRAGRARPRAWTGRCWRSAWPCSPAPARTAGGAASSARCWRSAWSPSSWRTRRSAAGRLSNWAVGGGRARRRPAGHPAGRDVRPAPTGQRRAGPSRSATARSARAGPRRQPRAGRQLAPDAADATPRPNRSTRGGIRAGRTARAGGTPTSGEPRRVRRAGADLDR